MKYLLSEKEYRTLKEEADRADAMQDVARTKEDRLTDVGLILHKILGTEYPPQRVNGMDCVRLAEEVMKKVMK